MHSILHFLFYFLFHFTYNHLMLKIFFLLCLALTAHGQAFSGLNLDRGLVNTTNNAISNLRGVLSLYSCSGSQLFQNNGGFGFNPQRYVLFSLVQTVIDSLNSITKALKANNIVQGSGNLVSGNGNILIGNNDIVNGNKLWVFACSQVVGGTQLLVLGNFRIDLTQVNSIMTNPSSAITCLNPNQVNDYFAQFSVQNTIPGSIAAQVNAIKLLI